MKRTSIIAKAFFTFHFGCVVLFTFAQTGVGSEEVIVVKEYEATIQDAQRIGLQPSIPEVEDKAPTFDYSIPKAEYKNFVFEPNPLKPIGIGKEKLEKFNASFIKLGFGGHLNPLAQLAYNDNRTANLKFGVLYNHYSMYGFKNKLQRFSDDEAGVYVRYFPKTFELGTAFNFHNYRTHFYGLSVDTLLTDSIVKPKDARQVFRTYDAQLYFRNAQKNNAGIDFNQDFRFNYLQEIFGKANEWFLAGNTDFKKKFLVHHFALGHFDFDASQLKYDTIKLQRNIFRFALGYGYDNDDWQAKAQIGMAILGKKVFPTADLHIEKRLYQHSVIAYLDYQLNYHKNSLLTFAERNRFVYNNAPLTNTLAGDFGAGLKGTIGNFSYNAAFHLNHLQQLALFVNDTNDYRRFTTVYDSNTLVYNGHVELGYNAKEWLRFSVIADYNHYQLKNQQRAWHEPNLRVTFRANYVWKNKIRVSVDVFGLSNSYALLKGGETATIKGVADVNLSAEYLMNKRFSFFGTLNNIGHFKYQRWYGYPSFGINGVLGAKFSF